MMNENFWLRMSTTGGTQNACRSSGIWVSGLQLIIKALFSYCGETLSGNGRTWIVLWLLLIHGFSLTRTRSIESEWLLLQRRALKRSEEGCNFS